MIKFDFIAVGPGMSIEEACKSAGVEIPVKKEFIPSPEQIREVERLVQEIKTKLLPLDKQGQLYLVTTMKGGGSNSASWTYELNGVESEVFSFGQLDDIINLVSAEIFPYWNSLKKQ